MKRAVGFVLALLAFAVVARADKIEYGGLGLRRERGKGLAVWSAIHRGVARLKSADRPRRHCIPRGRGCHRARGCRARD